MQQELDSEQPELGIDILGVNEFGHDSGNTLVTTDRDLPWLQDIDDNDDGNSDTWDSWDVTFRDVRLPASSIMGGEKGWNAGWGMLVGPGLDVEKIEVAAMALGIARAAVEDAWEYSQQREQFGKPICTLQSIRHMLAEVKTRLEACRLVTYDAAARIDQGQEVGVATSMAKLFVSDSAVEIVLTCQRVLGAYGYVGDGDMERYVRDVLAMPIIGGSSAVQKNNICNRLKLPR